MGSDYSDQCTLRDRRPLHLHGVHAVARAYISRRASKLPVCTSSAHVQASGVLSLAVFLLLRNSFTNVSFLYSESEGVHLLPCEGLLERCAGMGKRVLGRWVRLALENGNAMLLYIEYRRERIESSLNRFHYCMTITARWPPCRYVHCEAVSEPGVHSNDHTNADLQPNRLTAAAHIDSLQAFLARTRCPSFPRPRTLPFATSDFGPSQARQFPPHLLADPACAITLETRKYALPTTSSQTILRMSGRGAEKKICGRHLCQAG